MVVLAPSLPWAVSREPAPRCSGKSASNWKISLREPGPVVGGVPLVKDEGLLDEHRVPKKAYTTVRKHFAGM
jgi:hypothetical protein